MDISLQRYMDEYVYTSGGTGNSAIGICSRDLYQVTACKGWVDIGTGWKKEMADEEE